MAEAAALGLGPGGSDTFLTDMMTGDRNKRSGVGAKKSGKATFQTATKPTMRSNSSAKQRMSESKYPNYDDDQTE